MHVDFSLPLGPHSLDNKNPDWQCEPEHVAINTKM
jgi:hypothetical protein